MFNRIKDINKAGKKVIKQTVALRENAANAIEAIGDLIDFADSLQRDFNRWSFKNQPSLDRMQNILEKMK